MEGGGAAALKLFLANQPPGKPMEVLTAFMAKHGIGHGDLHPTTVDRMSRLRTAGVCRVFDAIVFRGIESDDRQGLIKAIADGVRSR